MIIAEQRSRRAARRKLSITEVLPVSPGHSRPIPKSVKRPRPPRPDALACPLRPRDRIGIIDGCGNKSVFPCGAPENKTGLCTKRLVSPRERIIARHDGEKQPFEGDLPVCLECLWKPTATAPVAPAPVAPPQPDVLCAYRSPAKAGRLQCTEPGPYVWKCSHPEIVSGYCIPRQEELLEDGYVEFPDGTRTEERYTPWHAPDRPNTIQWCDRCKHRAETLAYSDLFKSVVPRAWDEDLRFVRTADLAYHALDLIPQLPGDIVGVIGIPISGLIPASILSRHLCLPMFSLDQSGIISTGRGRRRRVDQRNRDGRYLVVDDSVYDGGEMKKARQRMKHEDIDAVFAAVYCRNPADVDVCAIHAPGSVMLEWNIFNQGCLSGPCRMPELKDGICCAMDGVICESLSDGVKGKDQYEQWLGMARPRYIPRRHTIPLIATDRDDLHRDATMKWLHRWGVSAREVTFSPTSKVQAFAASPCQVMVENDIAAAMVIAEEARKIVVVPRTGGVIRGDRA